MVAIKKDTKVYILRMTILFIAIASIMIAIDEQQTEINKLKTEITELEIQTENLLKQKQLYKEAIKLYEEVEESLNHQMGILESDIAELQEENEHLRMIRAKLTAYSPLDNRDGQQAEGNPNRTSRGYQVGRNIAAIGPKKIPYGTVLEIPGYGIVECQDTGGALRRDNKNIRIDLFHETYNQAMRFGVKDMNVKILEWSGE